MQETISDHRFSSIDDAKAFALAGNAIITLQSLRTGQHFTYKIQLPKDDLPGQPPRTGETPYFVKVLSEGSADEGQWTYLGMIRDGVFRSTKASAKLSDAACFKAFAFFWLSTELHPELTVRHEGRCGRCGRTLTHPESIDLGIGPECAKRME